MTVTSFTIRGERNLAIAFLRAALSMRLGEPLALDAALVSTAVEDRQGHRLCGTLGEEAYPQ